MNDPYDTWDGAAHLIHACAIIQHEKRKETTMQTPADRQPRQVTSFPPPDYMIEEAARGLNFLSAYINQLNVLAGWWTDIYTGESLLGVDEHGRHKRNVPEMLCLIHSEVSEAMEGYRKKLPDDKLPHRSMFEVELADTLIRIFDLAGAHKLDLCGAVREKLAYNQQREDHKLETRQRGEGKQF